MLFSLNFEIRWIYGFYRQLWPNDLFTPRTQIQIGILLQFISPPLSIRISTDNTEETLFNPPTSFSIKYSPDFLRCFSFNDSLRLSIYTTVFLKHIGKRHYGFLYSRKMWMHLFFVCLFTSIALLFFTILKIDFSTTIWKKDFKDTQQIQQTDRTFSIQYYPSAFTVS